MTLLQAHFVAASAWVGLLAAETVLELSARDAETRRFVARVHERIDLLFEGPMVATVLITGVILLYRLWPEASPLLLVKIGAGLTALLANVICIPLVIKRARTNDDVGVRAYARKIAVTGLAIPLVLLALALGLYGV